ncbi:polyamine ABC transporter substrate-binding protein [Chondromyces apiculatus]|uniref:ABC transporter, periplasmic spermidine putrescine-binding protein PotD n=1 Tax=Chondromyces apiculatus DSM 436 TaxID=1192034 RepID=A0A017T9K6_9BACT|nr:spermidine/putrescine ABC transporter substrate-binding protein [Chondromyces apiculatus]EYF05924.1 ABC transporter, periplasmic spermidine putrescine-binding protein PotD [Chondromyces apiculatus DSM 436]
MQRKHLTPATIAGLVGISLLAACGNKSKEESKAQPSGSAAESAASPKTPGEVSLLIFAEYIEDKIVSDFEKAASVRLRITTYESSEEMESKLSYGGADSQYDVVVASSQTVPRLVRKNLLQPLDHAKLTNLKNLEPRFSGPAFDDGNKFSVPYQWGTVGLMYDKKKLPNLEPSWGVVFDSKKIPGTFILLDEMRDMLGAVLKYKGHSTNSTNADEIREAGKILQDAKSHPKCLGFKSGVGAVQDVKSGSADIAVVWNGDALKEVNEDKERLAYINPNEGGVMWVDTMVISRRAPNAEGAHKFINFILEPEIGARLSTFTQYATPNVAARTKVAPEDQQNPAIYPPESLMPRLESHRDLGDNLKLFDEAWTAVKAH